MLKEQPVSYVVIRTGNQITFLLKLDVKWLRSPDRKFPLAIDPTVYPNNAVLWTGWANINGGNNDTVFAGFFSDGYPMVGFSRFNLTSIPDPSLIGAVTSNYYYFGRNGAMGGREMAIVAVEADPLTVPLYSDIAYSVTQYISSNFVVLQNNCLLYTSRCV